MRMVAPQVDAPCRVIAEEQEEYKPVTAAFVMNPLYGTRPGASHNTVLLAFRPNLSLLTFGGPLQPVILQVGKQAAADCYNVQVTS